MTIDAQSAKNHNKKFYTMAILLNFNGLNNTFRNLSGYSGVNLGLVKEEIQRNRVLMTPSRFKTIKGQKKDMEQSLKLCSETHGALLMYFGEDRLDKFKKLIGYDFVECILEEYISALRKLNYHVGEGDFLLRESRNKDKSEVVYASEVQLIEVKYI